MSHEHETPESEFVRKWKHDGNATMIQAVQIIATLTADRDKLLPIKWPECDCSGADLNGHHADYCAVFLNPARDQCLTCGNRMAHNPHPDAGKMFAVLEFGTEWFCIPCWLRTSRATLVRSWKYEREIEGVKAERDALRTALEEIYPIVHDAAGRGEIGFHAANLIFEVLGWTYMTRTEREKALLELEAARKVVAAGRELSAEVEMGEAIGVCLADRTPALLFMDSVAAYDRVMEEQSRG